MMMTNIKDLCHLYKQDDVQNLAANIFFLELFISFRMAKLLQSQLYPSRI